MISHFQDIPQFRERFWSTLDLVSMNKVVQPDEWSSFFRGSHKRPISLKWKQT